ncbi:MAG: hypothetical protein OEZ68_20545 [Gammaproteobacteria bacterium]|nr:hypothetical protein [Gammaproteobacteria bacterium]MDH5803194.1 hypothetical protein [Gammaproteobacteria bacterium]
MSESLYEVTCDARDRLYSSIGEVEPEVITHIINPAFLGGPAWPAMRQAFSVIHRGSNTIVVSNGLADPFDNVDEENSGFGIEIYAETKEPIEVDISKSDIFKLVFATAQQAAHSGQMANLLNQYKIITMELYAEDCGLYEYQTENGMVGIMIGIEHPDLPGKVDFPGGEVILATVQILTPSELDYVAQARAKGRNRLHASFKSSGIYHYVTPGRDSLIDGNDSQSGMAKQPNQKKPWWKLW